MNNLLANPDAFVNTGFNLANFVSWIVFGLVIGLLAQLVSGNAKRSSLVTTIVLGIVGSVVGGLIGNYLFGQPPSGFNVYSFGLAVVGALLISALVSSVSRKSGHIKTRPTNLV